MIVERWIEIFLTSVLKHSLEQDLVYNHVRVNVFLSTECMMHSALKTALSQ